MQVEETYLDEDEQALDVRLAGHSFQVTVVLEYHSSPPDPVFWLTVTLHY